MGFVPRMTFDWEARTVKSPTPRERLSREEAQQFAKRRAEAVAFARANIAKAQEAQRRQANKSRRVIDWVVGDKVYVRRGNWQTDRPHDGLDNPYVGPYKVLSNPYPNAYEIDLPESMKIRRVINASRLVRAPDNPVPGQVVPPPEPIVVEGEKEWTVSEILSSRLNYGRLQYLANWEGHDPDPTWYPASDFKHAPVRLREFHDKHPEAPGPPSRLDSWITAAAEDLEPPDHPDDNRPVLVKEGVAGTKRRRTTRL